MSLFFSTSKITPQLTSERLKGYKWILLGQVSIMISFLFVYEYFNQYPFNKWQQVLSVPIGLIMLAMNFLSYELIKDLSDNKFIRRTVLYLLWIGVVLAVLSASGIISKELWFAGFLDFISIAFSLIAFIILLYFMIYDIFNEKHDINYRLWGSASIYLLIGAIFGSFYTLLSIALPEQFQFVSEMPLFRFVPCYGYSFYTLAGIDAPYANFGILIKNISVIESIFSNLYIVLVVGRLLSK